MSSLQAKNGLSHLRHTMDYPKKTGFNLYQSRHCAYITYSVETWFLKVAKKGRFARNLLTKIDLADM